MPPQQPDRLLDVIDDSLGFRAHGSWSKVRVNAGFNDASACAQPHARRASNSSSRAMGSSADRLQRLQYNPPVPERIMRSASGETPTGRPSASVTPITE